MIRSGGGGGGGGGANGGGAGYDLVSSSTSLPRFAEHMEPHEICFQLSKTGRTRHLKQFLSKKSKEDKKRITGMKHNGATCLIMACRNGHFEVVEYLVEHCAASIEQTGLVNFEGENIEGAPPLWCASAAGHLKIVKYLVSKGANVNSTTKSNSTALRAACFDGHVDIVKFLVENNADIEIANRHGHTCLMIACYKGHLSIAKYLIMKGADLNRKSVKGNTALHDCAECGSLDIMKLLLSHNAKMAPDAYQMTPLLAAAVTGHSAIVEYLLTRPECEPMEKISALELLGATFVDKKHDMLSAYTYWKAALERRNSGFSFEAAEKGETSALSKERTIRHNPIEAYDFATEFMNEKELEEIIADPDDVRMQALLIRERILGPTHPDTTYYIRYRGAVYADCGNFRKCILLWLYALDTQQKSLDPLHPMIQSSFLSFTELFQYMQKQLPQFNATTGSTHRGGVDQLMGGDSANTSSSSSGSDDQAAAMVAVDHGAGNNSTSYNMLNMYTSTVIKILQQAVEEIKRGMSMIKQQQLKQLNASAASSNTATNSSSNSALSNNIHQLQRQKLQSSIAYNRTVNSAGKEIECGSGESSIINSSTDNIACCSSSSPNNQHNHNNNHSCSTTTAGDNRTISPTSSSSTCCISPSESSESNATTTTCSTTTTTTTSHATSGEEPTKQQQPQATIETGHFDRTLVVIVHFLCVVADSLRYCSPEETYKLKKLVYALVKLDPKSTAAKMSGLIHLASTRDSSSIIKNHTLSSFPSAQVLKLLLECGADPHSLDADKNSPLHLAAANRHFGPSSTSSPSSSSSQTGSERDKIILLLLNSGAHLDQCNAYGKTPADLYKNGKLYQVVNPINYLSLQCLCAKVIQKHKLPYKDQLTPKLAAFVAIH